MEKKILSRFFIISGLTTIFFLPVHATNTEEIIRAVCTSENGLNTKYYQQGIEVWGGDFFYDGSSVEEWMNNQDKRSGGSGDYTCYTQKVTTPYPTSVIDALKDAEK
ncbi:hypothetical protein CYG68_04935 [Morganella morganii]|uniref:Uncharacterized protein n=1 Tax=Morganella morganii TaxID=582 RepID=A0A8I0PUQ8_MORMO|nr:hypothetical protein [Morganella morganii]EMB6210989.1 hypothetical protein [Morganella morganii]MBE8611760.1 hypothetical protein [Morganella morganii]